MTDNSNRDSIENSRSYVLEHLEDFKLSNESRDIDLIIRNMEDVDLNFEVGIDNIVPEGSNSAIQ